jgi:flagellar basal-body rod protein FlgB
VDPSRIELFDLAERRMAWLDRRAAVLAENVANADTPGWQSRDLKPFSVALGQAGVTLLRTDSMHLAGTTADDPAVRVLAGERAPDGNSVRLDVELSKVADTESAQMLVGTLWKSYLGLFRTALGK